MKRNPFKDLILTKDERELEALLVKPGWSRIDNFKSWKKELQQAAKDTMELRKSKRITFRINKKDLLELKTKAKKKNIPYQTLLGALVRDYVEGEYTVRL